MFDVGQVVLVISDRGVSYDGVIMARATGDNGGPPAYQIAVHGREADAQWHKASDVFIVEERDEDPNSIERFLKK
jgi:hypothetical protein